MFYAIVEAIEKGSPIKLNKSVLRSRLFINYPNLSPCIILFQIESCSEPCSVPVTSSIGCNQVELSSDKFELNNKI